MCSLPCVVCHVCFHPVTAQAENKKHQEWVAEAESKLRAHYEECKCLDVKTNDGQKRITELIKAMLKGEAIANACSHMCG